MYWRGDEEDEEKKEDNTHLGAGRKQGYTLGRKDHSNRRAARTCAIRALPHRINSVRAGHILIA